MRHALRERVMPSLILESGARWPEWAMQRLRGRALRIAEQSDEESPRELLARARDLVDAEPLELCIIACNERCDDAAQSTRRELVQVLLYSLSSAGRIVLTANDHSYGPARRALTELACALDDGSGRVTVAFGHRALRPQEAA
jgi:hypothetical protein